MSEKPISLMIEALNLEIEAIRKRGSTGQIDIRGGECIGGADGNTLYRFPISEDLRLRDETPIRIILGKEEINGSLVSMREGVLIIALELNVGPKIVFARLITDESFLIERLRIKLEEVDQNIARFNKPSADKIIGQAAIKSVIAEPASQVFLGNPLNSEQKEVVRRSLGSDTTFLWGPPGTGKTTTLARIVESHYRAGHSVLLVSNTNIAVDTALEKIAERLETDAAFHAGAVLRYGPVVKPELINRYGKKVILEQVIAAQGADLEQQKQDAELEIFTLKNEISYINLALQEHEEAKRLKEKVAEGNRSLTAYRDQWVKLNDEIITHHNKLQKLNNDLERANNAGAIRRLFLRLNPERISREISKEESARRATESARQSLEATIKSNEITVANENSQLAQLSAKVSHYPNAAQCHKDLEIANNKIRQLQALIEAVKTELEALRTEVVKKCRILATTVYRTYLKGLMARDFDVVVIDEASMLMLPMSFYAAGLAQKAVIVAGDFRQLPAIVNSDEPLAKEWLQKDVFEKTNIPAMLARKQSPTYLVALREQFRMHEKICSCINGIFYADRPLHTDISVRSKPISYFPFGDSPLFYVNTDSFHPWASLRLGSYSRYNLFHALLIRNIAVHLNHQNYLSLNSDRNETLGIVSPYSAQIKLIQALLAESLNIKGTEFASTVHSFQGNEKETMLVDLTDSYGAWIGQFMKAVKIEEVGARLLNVAVSRAKERVILIANFAFLRAKAPASGIVRNLLDYFEQHGQSLDVSDLLPLGDNKWMGGFHQYSNESFEVPEGCAGIFNEGSFYPSFSQDLNKARNSITIFSPFLTIRGTSRWVDIFRSALGRGVSIRLLTRPPGNQGGVLESGLPETIDEIRKLGITVDLRTHMHEKIAIIDQDILWHGSLNIMSHNNTSESMLRLITSRGCEIFSMFATTPSSAKDSNPDICQPENPSCPQCGGYTIWNKGPYSIYFECEACNYKIDTRKRWQSEPSIKKQIKPPSAKIHQKESSVKNNLSNSSSADKISQQAANRAIPKVVQPTTPVHNLSSSPKPSVKSASSAAPPRKPNISQPVVSPVKTASIKASQQPITPRVFEGHTGGVYKVAFLPDGKRIISVGVDKTIRLWDINGEILRIVDGYKYFKSVDISADGRWVLFGNVDGTIHLIDIERGQELHSFTAHKDQVLSLAISEDGHFAISGALDKTIKLWDLKNKHEVSCINTKIDKINCLTFSSNNQLALTGSSDKVIRLWDMKSCQEVGCFNGHKDSISSIAFSRSNNQVISGSDDRTIRLWKESNNQQLGLLKNNGVVTCLTVSPNGSLALSGSKDKTVQLWDLKQQKDLARFEGHRDRVLSVAFSQDGHLAVSGSQDKTIRLWVISNTSI